MQSVREIVTCYFRLVNEERFDELFRLFDPDLEFSAPFCFSVRGLEHVKPFYLRVPLEYPEHEDTPTEILCSDNKAAVLIEFVGRTRHGLPVAFKAIDWFEIEKGKIKSLSIFFDSFSLARLLKGE